MVKPLYTAFLFSLVLAGPAVAQTAATTGGVAGTSLANPYGAVTLPGTPTPSSGAAGQSSSTASTSSAGGSGSGAGAGSGTSAPAPASSRSAATGTAARSGSSNVPAWLLCPPPGASGMAPFVTGTDLSCAP